MTLDLQAQKAGGAARTEKLEDWELKFVAMLGGSKRPITKNKVMSALQTTETLISEGLRFPWNIYTAVGMNGKIVPFDVKIPKKETLLRIQALGSLAGFCGVIVFKGAWRIYTRRVLIEPKAQDVLDSTSNFFLEVCKEHEREELEKRGEDARKAIASAEVYTTPDGKKYSMYYSFGRGDEFPEPGSVKAGTVYLVDRRTSAGRYDPGEDGSPWVVRFHMADPKNDSFAKVLKQATKLFAKKLRQIEIDKLGGKE